MIPILLTVSAYSANPFVDAMDDKPVSAKFRGTEWGDNIDEGEIALTARATTTRIAKVWWGAVFKIGFSDLRSRAPEPRKISPDYFIVTDERIVLLNEENNEAAIKTVSEMDQPPAFEPSDIYGIYETAVLVMKTACGKRPSNCKAIFVSTTPITLRELTGYAIPP